MAADKQKPSILIVAAEASSSLYALRLLEHWKSIRWDIRAYGVGSQAMEDAGFRRLATAEEMAVVGIQEVVSKLKLIRQTFNRLVEESKKNAPKVVLLMDYPDFNFLLAKKLRSIHGDNIKIVYYISPQVWAWRKGRINTIKKLVDHMIVALPFEEPFYRNHGVKVSFVGHPLLDEVRDFPWPADRVELERQRVGIPKGVPVLGLMPGSRSGEIGHHFDLQIQIAEKLTKEVPKLVSVLMVAPTLDTEKLTSRLGHHNLNLQVIKREPLSMISLADVILCASGTATLNVALAVRPMVVMYKMSPLTVWLARKIVTPPPYFSLPNLILDRLVCPELFQEDATIEKISKTLGPLLSNAADRERMRNDVQAVRNKLGEAPVAPKVSRIIQSYYSGASENPIS